MTSTSSFPRGASFTRNRAVRTVSGIATAGLMVGVSLAGASSASAATDADCNVANTVDATAAGTVGDVQTLMDVDTAVICLSGTFVLSSSLDFDYDLTLHGLTDAVLDGVGSYSILRDLGSNTLTVENLRFTNGTNFEGGAIRGNTVVVHNSQFDNNSAGLGGAISGSVVDIYDSVFTGNHADIFGGAILADTSVSATRTTFRGNSANEGGAIYSYGFASSDASTFEENTADYYAGALFANAVDVQNSTFVGNSVTTSDAGAIHAFSGSVRQSTFLDNAASDGAGQAVWANGALELRGNIFAGASASAQLRSPGNTMVDLGGNVFTTDEAAETALSSVQPTTQFGLTTAALFAGAALANNGGPTQTVALYAGSPALSAVPADAASMTVDQRGVARPAVSDAGAYEFDEGAAASGSGDGAGLAETGSEPAGWLVGTAGLLLAAGITVLAIVRRRLRSTV